MNMKRLASYAIGAYIALHMVASAPGTRDRVVYGQFPLNGSHVEYLAIKSGEKIKDFDFKIYSSQKDGDLGSLVIRHSDGIVTKTIVRENSDSPTGYEPVSYSGPDSLSEEDRKAISEAKSMIRTK